MRFGRGVIATLMLAAGAGCASGGGGDDEAARTTSVNAVVAPSSTSTTVPASTAGEEAPTTTRPLVPSTAKPSTSATTSGATTPGATTIATTSAETTSPEPAHTGSANECGGAMVLVDGDGDGWGECAAPPLDAATVIWWRRIGEFRQSLCEAGYDAANDGSLVAGGLDRVTYDFLCATLAAEGSTAG